MRFEAEYRIRQEELTRYKQFTATNGTRIFQLFIFLLGAYWGYGFFYDGSGEAWLLALACVIGALVFYGALYLLLLFTAALQSRRAVDIGKFRPYDQKLTIDHDGITVTINDERREHLDFSNVMRVSETASDFYIYQSKDMAFVLPKCQMGEFEEVSAQLREVLSTFLPKGKLRLLQTKQRKKA